MGGEIYDGPDVYAQDVAAGHDGDIVVWSLGDNGVATEDQVKALIEAVDPGKRVYLVTARVPLALQDINNALFKQVAAEHGQLRGHRLVRDKRWARRVLLG